MSQRHSSAVVLGAGMSGLLAARALSGHVARVTLVERDALPERDESRKGVPQSNDAHGLLASGYQAMELAAKQLPVLPGAGERQDVDAGDVRERAHLPAELYEDRSLWVPAERHARFEDDIQPWLKSRVRSYSRSVFVRNRLRSRPSSSPVRSTTNAWAWAKPEVTISEM